jgi:hypothetical protein
MFSNWILHYLNSNIKVFLFKYYNNTLGIHSRVSHFKPEAYGGCTFCSISKLLPAPKETMLHLFYPCPHTPKILMTFIQKNVRNINLDEQLFFLAKDSEFEYENNLLELS